MTESTTLTSFFEAKEFDPASFDAWVDMVYASGASRDYFRELLNDARAADGDAQRLGIGLLILGQFSDAIEQLKKARDDRFRRYYAGKAMLSLGRYEDAIAEFQRAASHGWDAFDADVQVAHCQLRSGETAAAEKAHRRLERSGADKAAWFHLGGLLHETRNDWAAAIAEYEKALAIDDLHAPSMFGAARLYDLRGDDELAIELYEKLAHQPRSRINALINLAVLHEDRGEYDEARDCLRRVLSANPNHARARLFLKDVESGRLMMLDDHTERKAETRNRLLEAPVAEFELSVRARNCLKKMKVHTLGELIKLTEPELLSYKNFGETSLMEIKALLSKRGLKLGMNPDEVDVSTLAAAAAAPPVAAPRVHVPPGAEALLAKPVAELELSVRARRCLQRLNVGTVGDLIQKTEAELLATRNFGVTSLSEIKARLVDLNLALATKP